MKPKVFVPVHPAWHGAWCWKKVVPLLRQAGRVVFTPTLTGLGERSHLARPEIGLDVHVTDVINELTYEDLRDVVLVGHSSSGAVITGVADLVPARIGLVVYLDAFVPDDGQAVLDLVTSERRQVMEALVKTEGDGWLLPRFAPPPWETIVRDMWGVADDDDVRWMLDRLGPTPFGHLKDSLHFTNPVAEKLPRAYIHCRRFPNPRFDQHAEMAQRSSLRRYSELAAPPSPRGHYARRSHGSVASTFVLINCRGCRGNSRSSRGSHCRARGGSLGSIPRHRLCSSAIDRSKAMQRQVG